MQVDSIFCVLLQGDMWEVWTSVIKIIQLNPKKIFTVVVSSTQGNHLDRIPLNPSKRMFILRGSKRSDTKLTEQRKEEHWREHWDQHIYRVP